MKTTIPSILLFLFFSLHSVHAKKYDHILVPSYMSGVKVDPSQKGSHYSYDGGVVVNKDVRALDSNGVEGFVKRLFRIYRNKDMKAFRELLTEKALSKMESLGRSVIMKEWQTLTNATEAKLRNYFPIEGGVIVSWEVGGIPRGLFLVEKNNKFKIDDYHADSDNVSFHNRSLFFTYLPIKERPAEATKTFELSDPIYELVFEVEKERAILHLLKKNGDVWESKVQIKDNSIGKGRFDDLDPREGFIRIKFKKENFTQGKEHELLVLKSNFPIDKYPVSESQKPNLIISP